MAITDDLNELWGINETMDDVFEFRATFENAYNVILETIEKIDEIIARGNLGEISQELITEGQTCRQALNDAKLILNDHTEFIIWRQPE